MLNLTYAKWTEKSKINYQQSNAYNRIQRKTMVSCLSKINKIYYEKLEVPSYHFRTLKQFLLAFSLSILYSFEFHLEKSFLLAYSLIQVIEWV